MKANEYKAWYRRNDPGSAGSSAGGYGRPFKERYERPPEYSVGSEAYKHYPAMVDISEKQEAFRKGDEDKNAKGDGNKSESKKRSERMRRDSAARTAVSAVAGPVAGVVVGAVILVSGYQAIELEAAPELPPVVSVIDCDWNGDYTEATITLTGENGTFIATIPAVVSVSEEKATCDQEGALVYTAEAEHNGETYKKTHTEPIPAKGHSFSEGKVVLGESGEPVMEYECADCEEKVTVKISVSEE